MNLRNTSRLTNLFESYLHFGDRNCCLSSLHSASYDLLKRKQPWICCANSIDWKIQHILDHNNIQDNINNSFHHDRIIEWIDLLIYNTVLPIVCQSWNLWLTKCFNMGAMYLPAPCQPSFYVEISWFSKNMSIKPLGQYLPAYYQICSPLLQQRGHICTDPYIQKPWKLNGKVWIVLRGGGEEAWSIESSGGGPGCSMRMRIHTS